jgi:hypothetical protein
MENLRLILRIIKKNLRRLNALAQHYYKQQSEWTCPVIHVRRLTKLPPSIALPLLCGRSKGKLTCPPELTIVLIHNYESEPIMEKSLRYVGIKNFVVLRPKSERPWCNTMKFVELKRFLDSGSCKTKFVLFCDSDDAVLRDDPAKAIRFLEEEGCDLLLSNTSFDAAYECMPDVQEWADEIARQNGKTQYYINSGVFIGRLDFLREVLGEALKYISDNDFSREEYWRVRENGTLCKSLPEFPKGIGSDQVILRYLHPRFYPRMKIDYKDRLAMR